MAGYQNAAEAYDFSMFEPQREMPVRQRTATAPLKKPELETVELKVVPKRTEQQEKQQQRIGFRRAVFAFFSCFVIFMSIAMFISSSVKSAEVSSQIAEMQTQIKNAESENVRLRAAVNGMYNIANVEKYAQDVLGMSKMEEYQIRYVDLSESDAVLYAGPQHLSGGDIFDAVKEYFAQLFA